MSSILADYQLIWSSLREAIVLKLLARSLVQTFSINYTERDIHVTTLNYEYHFRANDKTNVIDVFLTNRSNKQAYRLAICFPKYNMNEKIELLFTNSRVLHRLAGKINRLPANISSQYSLYLGICSHVYIVLTAIPILGTGVKNSSTVNIADLKKTTLPELWDEFLTDLSDFKTRNGLSDTELEILQTRCQPYEIANDTEEPDG